MVREGMRGADQQQNHIFSYVSPEERVRKDHPLRIIRTMMDEVLQQLSRRLDSMYAKVGRPSIPPEQLLRAQLLQMLYCDSQRTAADGTDRLQHVVSLVYCLELG
jgi:transposase